MKCKCCDCGKDFILSAEAISEYAQITHTVSSDYYPDDGGWRCMECVEDNSVIVKPKGDFNG